MPEPEIPPNGMKTVYLLGAGASAQYAAQGTAVPVTANFLKVALESFPKDYPDVIDFLKFIYGPEVNAGTCNVEEVLSVLDLGRGRPEGMGARYSQANLDVLYDRSIKLVWETLKHCLRGNPCALHRDLVSRMGHNDSIVSFNWDILIDNALLRDESNLGLFDVSCGYGFEPKLIEIPNGNWTASTCIHLPDNARRKLFKLHGSMNWLRCLECSEIFVLSGRKAVWENAVASQSCPTDGAPLKPMIVPFTWMKRFDTKPYGQIWRSARLALQRAEAIVVIGYSLPESDFHARDLIIRAMAENTHLKSVHLVDIQMNGTGGEILRQRFGRLFRLNIPSGYCYPSTAAFLNDTAP